MTPGETVTAFIKANESKDINAVLDLCTDDVFYENVPMSAMNGKDEVRATLEPFYAMVTGIEWVVHRQFESGNEVANERTDRFEINGQWHDARVAGFFEVRDGKVAFWRDYFDLTPFTAMFSG
jgi:limonene-1,2-epoxide hydrolase